MEFTNISRFTNEAVSAKRHITGKAAFRSSEKSKGLITIPVLASPHKLYYY